MVTLQEDLSMVEAVSFDGVNTAIDGHFNATPNAAFDYRRNNGSGGYFVVSSDGEVNRAQPESGEQILRVYYRREKDRPLELIVTTPLTDEAEESLQRRIEFPAGRNGWRDIFAWQGDSGIHYKEKAFPVRDEEGKLSIQYIRRNFEAINQLQADQLERIVRESSRQPRLTRQQKRFAKFLSQGLIH